MAREWLPPALVPDDSMLVLIDKNSEAQDLAAALEGEGAWPDLIPTDLI